MATEEERLVIDSLPGVAISVLLAINTDYDADDWSKQPEWLWYSHSDGGDASFGRWPGFADQVPYIRGDKVELAVLQERRDLAFMLEEKARWVEDHTSLPDTVAATLRLAARDIRRGRLLTDEERLDNVMNFVKGEQK